MSLAVTIPGGLDTGTPRVTLLAGAAMAAALGLSAAEQWREGLAVRHWALALTAALACAAWSLFLVWRDRRRLTPTLAIGHDGGLRFGGTPGRAPLEEAAPVVAWRLGPVFFLHARVPKKVACPLPAAVEPQSEASAFEAVTPAPASREYRLLLIRRRMPEADWHALCRWLVWHRRCGRGSPLATEHVRNPSQPV